MVQLNADIFAGNAARLTADSGSLYCAKISMNEFAAWLSQA